MREAETCVPVPCGLFAVEGGRNCFAAGRSVVAEGEVAEKNFEKKDPRRTARHDGIERANGTQASLALPASEQQCLNLFFTLVAAGM